MTAPLSLYVHVPFCASRCGYCDFNTYTAAELGSQVQRASFHEHLIAEIELARATVGPREVGTVFFGGGTPSLLGSQALREILESIRGSFGLAHDAEVTSEANPDSVDLRMLEELREGGFTRMSFGMQSSSPTVLSVLERTHTPGSSAQAARWAAQAGFEHVNLDMIYGTPGETDADVRRTLAEIVEAGVDHVSAYSLIVEEGTALARKVNRGEIPAVDDDVCAHRYELIDSLLTDAGFRWYEVSNWSKPQGECAHNRAYWRSADWWGVGPGAHSHVAGERWWNVKHPATYVSALHGDGELRAGSERITDHERLVERAMLDVRVSGGFNANLAADPGTIQKLQSDGLVEKLSDADDRWVLTLRGRLLADHVTRSLLG